MLRVILLDFIIIIIIIVVVIVVVIVMLYMYVDNMLTCACFHYICLYSRLSHGQVVTSFYSVVNSCCICVPCTYRELRQSEHFPSLKFLSDDEATHNPKSVFTEVGKIIAKNTAPLESLHGKNVIEIDHKIRLTEQADEFNFNETSKTVKKMVTEQEQNLIKLASYRIQDKGGVYHIKGSNSIEQNMNESVVW